MSKEEFLAAIRERLAGLPPLDIERAVEYYNEVIDDHVEKGMSVEEAVAAVGTVEEAAAQIAADTPLPSLMRAKVKPTRTWRVWEIVLLVLGSPVWVPLLLVVLVLVLVVWLLLWAGILVLYALDLSLAAAGLAGLAGSAASLVAASPTVSLFWLGVGLSGAGLAVLLFFGCTALTHLLARGTRWALRRFKSGFVSKRRGKHHE